MVEAALRFISTGAALPLGAATAAGASVVPAGLAARLPVEGDDLHGLAARAAAAREWASAASSSLSALSSLVERACSAPPGSARGAALADAAAAVEAFSRAALFVSPSQRPPNPNRSTHALWTRHPALCPARARLRAALCAALRLRGDDPSAALGACGAASAAARLLSASALALTRPPLLSRVAADAGDDGASSLALVAAAALVAASPSSPPPPAPSRLQNDSREAAADDLCALLRVTLLRSASPRGGPSAPSSSSAAAAAAAAAVDALATALLRAPLLPSPSSLDASPPPPPPPPPRAISGLDCVASLRVVAPPHTAPDALALCDPSAPFVAPSGVIALIVTVAPSVALTTAWALVAAPPGDEIDETHSPFPRAVAARWAAAGRDAAAEGARVATDAAAAAAAAQGEATAGLEAAAAAAANDEGLSVVATRLDWRAARPCPSRPGFVRLPIRIPQPLGPTIAEVFGPIAIGLQLVFVSGGCSEGDSSPVALGGLDFDGHEAVDAAAPALSPAASDRLARASAAAARVSGVLSSLAAAAQPSESCVQLPLRRALRAILLPPPDSPLTHAHPTDARWVGASLRMRVAAAVSLRLAFPAAPPLPRGAPPSPPRPRPSPDSLLSLAAPSLVRSSPEAALLRRCAALPQPPCEALLALPSSWQAAAAPCLPLRRQILATTLAAVHDASIAGELDDAVSRLLYDGLGPDACALVADASSHSASAAEGLAEGGGAGEPRYARSLGRLVDRVASSTLPALLLLGGGLDATAETAPPPPDSSACIVPLVLARPAALPLLAGFWAALDASTSPSINGDDDGAAFSRLLLPPARGCRGSHSACASALLAMLVARTAKALWEAHRAEEAAARRHDGVSSPRPASGAVASALRAAYGTAFVSRGEASGGEASSAVRLACFAARPAPCVVLEPAAALSASAMDAAAALGRADGAPRAPPRRHFLEAAAAEAVAEANDAGASAEGPAADARPAAAAPRPDDTRGAGEAWAAPAGLVARLLPPPRRGPPAGFDAFVAAFEEANRRRARYAAAGAAGRTGWGWGGGDGGGDGVAYSLAEVASAEAAVAAVYTRLLVLRCLADGSPKEGEGCGGGEQMCFSSSVPPKVVADLLQVLLLPPPANASATGGGSVEHTRPRARVLLDVTAPCGGGGSGSAAPPQLQPPPPPSAAAQARLAITAALRGWLASQRSRGGGSQDAAAELAAFVAAPLRLPAPAPAPAPAPVEHPLPPPLPAAGPIASVSICYVHDAAADSGGSSSPLSAARGPAASPDAPPLPADGRRLIHRVLRIPGAAALRVVLVARIAPQAPLAKPTTLRFSANPEAVRDKAVLAFSADPIVTRFVAGPKAPLVANGVVCFSLTSLLVDLSNFDDGSAAGCVIDGWFVISGDTLAWRFEHPGAATSGGSPAPLYEFIVTPQTGSDAPLPFRSFCVESLHRYEPREDGVERVTAHAAAAPRDSPRRPLRLSLRLDARCASERGVDVLLVDGGGPLSGARRTRGSGGGRPLLPRDVDGNACGWAGLPQPQPQPADASSSSFCVRFRSDASIESWGWRLHASAAPDDAAPPRTTPPTLDELPQAEPCVPWEEAASEASSLACPRSAAAAASAAASLLLPLLSPRGAGEAPARALARSLWRSLLDDRLSSDERTAVGHALLRHHARCAPPHPHTLLPPPMARALCDVADAAARRDDARAASDRASQAPPASPLPGCASPFAAAMLELQTVACAAAEESEEEEEGAEGALSGGVFGGCFASARLAFHPPTHPHHPAFLGRGAAVPPLSRTHRRLSQLAAFFEQTWGAPGREGAEPPVPPARPPPAWVRGALEASFAGCGGDGGGGDDDDSDGGAAASRFACVGAACRLFPGGRGFEVDMYSDGEGGDDDDLDEDEEEEEDGDEGTRTNTSSPPPLIFHAVDPAAAGDGEESAASTVPADYDGGDGGGGSGGDGDDSPPLGSHARAPLSSSPPPLYFYAVDPAAASDESAATAVPADDGRRDHDGGGGDVDGGGDGDATGDDDDDDESDGDGDGGDDDDDGDDSPPLGSYTLRAKATAVVGGRPMRPGSGTHAITFLLDSGDEASIGLAALASPVFGPRSEGGGDGPLSFVCPFGGPPIQRGPPGARALAPADWFYALHSAWRRVVLPPQLFSMFVCFVVLTRFVSFCPSFPTSLGRRGGARGTGRHRLGARGGGAAQRGRVRRRRRGRLRSRRRRGGAQ